MGRAAPPPRVNRHSFKNIIFPQPLDADATSGNWWVDLKAKLPTRVLTLGMKDYLQIASFSIIMTKNTVMLHSAPIFNRFQGQIRYLDRGSSLRGFNNTERGVYAQKASRILVPKHVDQSNHHMGHKKLLLSSSVQCQRNHILQHFMKQLLYGYVYCKTDSTSFEFKAQAQTDRPM